jgi:hypothetical protein
MVRAMQPFIFDHGGASNSFWVAGRDVFGAAAAFWRASARCGDGQWVELRRRLAVEQGRDPATLVKAFLESRARQISGVGTSGTAASACPAEIDERTR